MFQFKTLVQVIEDFLGLRAEANFLRVAHLMFEGNFFFSWAEYPDALF